MEDSRVLANVLTIRTQISTWLSEVGMRAAMEETHPSENN